MAVEAAHPPSTGTDADPRPGRRPRFGRPSATDVALAALLFALSVFVAVGDPDASSAQRLAAAALGAAQLLPVLWRRSHPVAGLVAYSAAKPVEYAAALPVSEWAWLVLVYSLFAYRRPRLAVPVLVGTLLVIFPVSAAAVAAAREVNFWGVLAGLGAVVTPQLAVVAALGWAVRAARARTARQRELADRARRAEAIEHERARIADELNGVVVRRLQRVTALTQHLRGHLEESPDSARRVLSEVHDEAKQALTAMRRTLGLLRTERYEPAPEEGDHPPNRWAVAPTPSGIALAVGFGAAMLLSEALLPAGPPTAQLAELWPILRIQDANPVTLPLLVVEIAVLGWWRSAPLAALTVSTLGACASSLTQTDHLVADFGWMLLVYAAGAGAPPVRSAVVAAINTLAFLAAFLVSESTQPRFSFTTAELVFSYLFAGCLWAVGAVARRAAGRAQRQADERAADDTRSAVYRERNRIARELHDVIAHHVSAIVVQAGAARSVAASEPGVVRDAVEHIEESGRQTLDSLPDLLDVAPETDANTGAALRDAAGVEQLIAPLRSAGLPVTVEIKGEPTERGGEAELFAERILMESLTNVLRHAGPSRTRVVLDHHPDAVTLSVSDDGPVAGHRGAGDGGGHGVVGMRERAVLLGGELAAGNRAGGGWLVRARLPRRPTG